MAARERVDSCREPRTDSLSCTNCTAPCLEFLRTSSAVTSRPILLCWLLLPPVAQRCCTANSRLVCLTSGLVNSRPSERMSTTSGDEELSVVDA